MTVRMYADVDRYGNLRRIDINPDSNGSGLLSPTYQLFDPRAERNFHIRDDSIRGVLAAAWLYERNTKARSLKNGSVLIR